MPPPSTPVFSHRDTKSSYRDRKLLLILSATAKPSPHQRPRSSASSLLPLARWRERGPGGEGGDRANPSAAKLYARRSQAIAIASACERCFPSPAGGRGGRGVRVVSAQPQAPQSFTRADRKQSQSRAHARASPPRPLAGERPGGEGGVRATPSPQTTYAAILQHNRSTPCPFAKAALSRTSSQSSCLAFSSLESKMTPSSHYAKIQNRVSW